MPFIFCIYFAKQNKYRDIKVFFVYTILLFISILLLLTFRYIFKSHQSYQIFQRFFIIAEYSLISIFFTYNIRQLRLRKIIRASIVLFSLFSVYDITSTINEPFTYYPLVLECLLLPLIIVLFFYEKMKYSTKYPVYSSPAFWIAVAFLIFSTGNFFLFLFSKLFVQDLHSKLLYNNVYGFFTILKNTLLCTGIFIAKNYKIEDEWSDINTNLELDSFIPFNKK